MDLQTQDHHEGHDAHGGDHPATPPTPTDLKDPVCGMTVTGQSQHRLEHEGRPYYFCSAKCKDKFAADPLRYVAPSRPVEPPTQVAAAVGTI